MRLMVDELKGKEAQPMMEGIASVFALRKAGQEKNKKNKRLDAVKKIAKDQYEETNETK